MQRHAPAPERAVGDLLLVPEVRDPSGLVLRRLRARGVERARAQDPHGRHDEEVTAERVRDAAADRNGSDVPAAHDPEGSSRVRIRALVDDHVAAARDGDKRIVQAGAGRACPRPQPAEVAARLEVLAEVELGRGAVDAVEVQVPGGAAVPLHEPDPVLPDGDEDEIRGVHVGDLAGPAAHRRLRPRPADLVVDEVPVRFVAVEEEVSGAGRAHEHDRGSPARGRVHHAERDHLGRRRRARGHVPDAGGRAGEQLVGGATRGGAGERQQRVRLAVEARHPLARA